MKNKTLTLLLYLVILLPFRLGKKKTAACDLFLFLVLLNVTFFLTCLNLFFPLILAQNIVVFPSRAVAIENSLRLFSPRLAIVDEHLTRHLPRQWLTSLAIEVCWFVKIFFPLVCYINDSISQLYVINSYYLCII